jgi:hypothetical protein
MNVYELDNQTYDPRLPVEGQDCYQELLLVGDENTRKLSEFKKNGDLEFDRYQGWFKDGKTIGKAWLPIRVVVNEASMLFPAGDFPNLPGLSPNPPIFSAHAVEILDDLLLSNGELLPLICDEGTYYAFNVTKIVDTLDGNKSEFKSLCEIDPDTF